VGATAHAGSNHSEHAASRDLADEVDEVARQIELADPDVDASVLDRSINRVAEFIGVSTLATIAVLLFANALGRYAFNSPVIWAEELVIELIPWLTMCGVFLSVRRRQIIRIEFFVSMLPAQVRRAASVFASIVSAAAFTYLAIHSLTYVSLFGSDPLDYLRIPTGWFSSALMVGAAATVLAFIVEAVRTQIRRD
jgi:TRAP-type C4-dicarboxylate transport system permease small subunit